MLFSIHSPVSSEKVWKVKHVPSSDKWTTFHTFSIWIWYHDMLWLFFHLVLHSANSLRRKVVYTCRFVWLRKANLFKKMNSTKNLFNYTFKNFINFMQAASILKCKEQKNASLQSVASFQSLIQQQKAAQSDETVAIGLICQLGRCFVTRAARLFW